MKQNGKTFMYVLFLVLMCSVVFILLSLFARTKLEKKLLSSSGKPTPDITTPTGKLTPNLLGSVTLSEGSCSLKLSSNHVAIGTAELFQDVLESKNPPITIFIIYGAAEITVSLKNGGWEIWENASAEWIDDQLSEKIEKAKAIYSDKFKTRGYRVVECYSQVNYCSVLETMSNSIMLVNEIRPPQPILLNPINFSRFVKRD